MKRTHTGGSVCVCAATTTNAPDFTFLQLENKSNDKRKGWKRISNDGSQESWTVWDMLGFLVMPIKNKSKEVLLVMLCGSDGCVTTIRETRELN